MNQNTCCLCLETANARGGEPLSSPGCCGAWFHQRCLFDVVRKGNGLCPCCRAPFPSNIIPQMTTTPVVVATPVAPPVRQAPNLLQLAANIFTGATAAATPVSTSDEDPASTVIVESTGSTTSAPISLILKTTPESSQISVNGVASFHVVGSIGIRDDPSIYNSRKSMDIVCVLDKSGSMSGSKFSYLKQAMRFVHTQLTDKDRLSLVTFDNRVSKVHSLWSMNQTRKNQSEELLNNLSAGGGTDIYAGMRMGSEILFQRSSESAVSCMFLLTDGINNSHLAEKKALAAQLKTRGISLFVFAFGADHDSDHLNAIATAGEGSFIYVAQTDQVVDAFGGALGAQQGLAAKDVKLHIAAVAENVVLDEINGGAYQSSVGAGRRSGTVAFSNLILGEKRDVLVRVIVPAVPGAVPRYPLLELSASYTTIGETSQQVQSSVQDNDICYVERVLGDVSLTAENRDVEVDAQMYRLSVSETMKQAMDLADSGKIAEARALVQQKLDELRRAACYVKEHPISRQLQADLERTLNSVRDTSSYASQGGRANITYYVASNSRQRCAYDAEERNVYQTSASSAMQSASKVYKGSMSKR